MKILIEGFKGRFEQAEKIISKLGDRTMELTKSETQKENMLKDSEKIKKRKVNRA